MAALVKWRLNIPSVEFIEFTDETTARNYIDANAINGYSLDIIQEIAVSDAGTVNETIAKPVGDWIRDLLDDFLSENIAMGVTQAGKTALVGIALKDVSYWVSVKSLYEVMSAANAVNCTPDLAPFVTRARMNAFNARIINYLKTGRG